MIVYFAHALVTKTRMPRNHKFLYSSFPPMSFTKTSTIQLNLMKLGLLHIELLVLLVFLTLAT